MDARNVLRSQWPNIPEHEVVSRSAAWAAENDARALVVFDGRAPGGLVGEQDVDQACSVVGTGRESADDWLIRAADELTAKNSRYWLVTSDRALRAIAGRAAERTIGGGAFSRELRP